MSDEVKPVKPSVKDEADKAIADGSDKSKGGYDALMDDFNRASQTFSKPADMEAYSKQVIDGLKASGTLGDHARTFAEENFDRLNNKGEAGDKGLDRSEVSPNKANNALERAFLQNLTDNFASLQDKRWYQNEKGGVITRHDLKNALEERDKPRDDRQREGYEADRAVMANKDVQDFSKVLFANKNGGADSLFNRLDVLDRDADGQFGRKSLESYLRLADTDPNLPHKELVGRMLNEWDKPAMQAMRGERPDHGNNRDHMNGPTYNDNININRLARTLGSDPDSLFKNGRSDGTAAAASPDRVPPPRQSAIAEVHDRPRDNRGREGQLPGAPVPGRRVEQQPNEPVPRNREQPPRRPVEPTSDVRPQARPVDAAPPQTEAPPPRPVEVRTDPKVPDFKADINEQDLAKTREAYAQELAKTYQERTMRKVEAGDGWDRIARRELRASGQDASEQNVVKYSEEIAKLNGRTGRLDTDNILKRDQPPVRVHTDEWAQEQVKAKLDEFDKEVAKRKAAAAAAAAPPVDNFNDRRSGGTDVKPPVNPAAKPAAEIPRPGGPQAAIDAAPKVAPEAKPGQPALVESTPPAAAAKTDAAPKAPAEAPKAPADAARVAPDAPKDDAVAKAKAEADAAAAAAKAKTESDAAAAAAKAKIESDAAKVKADADAKARADAAKAKADADARAKASKTAAPALDVTDLGPPGS
ncbi:MAG: hypothetical protein KA392_17955 [Candidatus Obscuribacter sp.]|nr:hypothetical protein [Candidatus Obscuribacter sp.]MBP6594804.1 hypothetical protein [Candidatus Obscuribacter sp.]